MSGVSIAELAKAYDQTKIVHDISLDIQSGEFIVLVGPSGCGKSTILRMIAGLEDATSGSIYIDGEDVTNTAASKRGVAMVFQSYALYPHMTVRENLSFGLKNMKYDKSRIESQVNHAASVLRLTDYLDRNPSQLSGGQRQRVAIGRAIVRDPKVFLFDEPLSNLDAELRVEMRHELVKLHKDFRHTMIYVTHDQVEAMTLADRIVVVNEGRIEQVGSPLEIYNHPRNTFTASFIGSPKINLLNGKVLDSGDNKLSIMLVEDKDICLEVTVPGLRVGDDVILGFRPEHVTRDSFKGGIALDLILSQVESLGDSTYIYAKLFDAVDCRVKLQGQHHLAATSRMAAYIAPHDILLFDSGGDAIPSKAPAMARPNKPAPVTDYAGSR
jgi:ABC-type sugar transport system ATPase subunit